MKIESISDLKALISLMRKSGIDEIKADTLHFKLNPKPMKRSRKPQVQRSPIYDPATGLAIPDLIQTDMPQGEDLLFYSSEPQQNKAD